MKTIKELFPLLLSIILLAPAHVLAKTIDIRSCPDLKKMNEDLFGKYVLANDIDCKNATLSKIGSARVPFMGSFDGQGHTIANFSIAVIEQQYDRSVGLFAYTDQAEISNLKLHNATIFVSSYQYINGSIGILIGSARGTTVSNASVNGTISQIDLPSPATLSIGNVGGLVGSTDKTHIINANASVNIAGPFIIHAGGLVGKLDRNSSIQNSYAAGKLKVRHTSGGLVGWVINSSVVKSYATGSVEGYDPTEFHYAFGGLIGALVTQSEQDRAIVSQSYATGEVNGGTQGDAIGGLVGNIDSYVYTDKRSFTLIENSYATGKVTGYQRIGGLVGNSYNLHLINCYSTGKVIGLSDNFVGGLVGEWYLTPDYAVNNYWDMQTSGQSLSSAGIGKATSEMVRQQTYTNWDFQSIWTINEGQSYPSLQ